MLNSIQNPITTCLPKQIEQTNLLKIDKSSQLKMSNTPMFSEVETTKNNKYVIDKEVMEMITEDIKAMLKDNE